MGAQPPDRSGSRPRHDRSPAHRFAGHLTLLACAASALAPGSAAAASTAVATTAANTVSQAATVPAGWTGSTATCSTGTESAASLDATLQAVNAFRAVANLPAVSFDPAMSQQALTAALTMRAGNENGSSLGLSHDPPPTWPCWTTEGDQAAGRSNLALGSSGAAAIRLYMSDEAVDGVGHRRWILDPSRTTFGSGSTGSTNALLVIGGGTQPVASGTQVAWPPAGAIAPAWLPTTWSLSVGGTGDSVALSAPQVSMTLDGAPVAVSKVSDLGTGYGMGRALGWVPAIDRAALRTGYHELAVSISGFSVNGMAEAVSYTTTLGTAPPLTATPAALPTPTGPSSPTPPIVPLAELPHLKPKIKRGKGTPRPGRRLTATFQQGTGRIVTKIQWYRGKRAIKRANSIHYRLTRADRGKTIRVRLTSQARNGAWILAERSKSLRIPRR